ncbi:MAG: RNA polymerase sigma factor [Spirochaetota bacterium]
MELVREGSAPTDQDLITRHKTGDSGAANALLARYKDYIFRLCYRYMQNYEDAMDLMQEVLVRMFRALDRYEERNYLKGWIYRIVANTAINMKKVNARRAVPNTDYFETVRDEHADATSPLAVSFLTEMISRAAQTLSGKQRDVFFLRYYEQMSYGEIARAIKISANSAKSNYFYALTKVKAALERAGVHL